MLDYDGDWERSVVAIAVQRAVENVKIGVGAYRLRVTGNMCSAWPIVGWRSWLRHCATSRKVAGSIPDCIIGIFH